MKPCRMFLVAFVALGLLFASSSLAAASSNPLALVPSDSEFIASVNVRRIADAPLFQRLLDEKGGQKVQAGLQIVSNLTGVDLMKDLDRVVLWGRVKDDDSVAAVCQGRFDEEKLLPLLQVNPRYRETKREDLRIHEWFDPRENRMKFGAFLPDGAILLANQMTGFDDALESRSGGKGFLATVAEGLLPDDPENTAAWMVLLSPDRLMPDGRVKDTLRADSAMLSVSFTDSSLAMRLAIHLRDAQAARDWITLTQGFLALMRLQQDKAGLHKLAEKLRIHLAQGTHVVTVDLLLTLEDLLSMDPIARQLGGQARNLAR